MKQQLKPCPFCGVVPKQDPALVTNNYVIYHEKGCFFFPTDFWRVWSDDDMESWNRRDRGET